MNRQYLIHDPSQVFSPGLVFYRSIILANIQKLLDRVGGKPERLRPHCKTHKTREIVRLQMERGITKHKCATIAEAEMLGQIGVPDIMLAYPIIGPNCARLAKLVRLFPNSRFSTLADHPDGAQMLSDAMRAASVSVEVLVDLDVGQHRTGIPANEDGFNLYARIADLPGIKPGGLHVYDGHVHQHDVNDRQQSVDASLNDVLALKDRILRSGMPIPRMVLGGTPTFPVYAKMDWQDTECSPGTCVLNDFNYGVWFPDLEEFQHAALLVTRVVSRPTKTRVTFDLGYKAVASDPPAGKRCVVMGLEKGEAVLHNEEHLVFETPDAENYRIGDFHYALPSHVCPTSALHRFAYVVDEGNVVDQWEIVGRDRVITV